MPTATEQIATFLSVEGEPVEGEPWFWVAHYDDGSFLAQFDGATGRFHRFREIEASRLARFELRAAFSPALRFELPVRPGMRPIHFYRNVVLNAARRRRCGCASIASATSRPSAGGTCRRSWRSTRVGPSWCGTGRRSARWPRT